MKDVEFVSWPLVPRGGQHTGNSTGVLAVHVPTGLAFLSKSHRSNFKNREEAVTALELLLPLWGVEADVND